MLNRTINITNEHNDILWEKNGDFTHASYFGFAVPLIRAVEYKNTHNTGKIEKFEIFGYRDDDIVFTLQIARSEFASITRAIVNAGYLPPYSTENRIYRINIPNVQFASDFLQALASLEPSINAIAPEIIATIKPYSKEEPTIPGWVKSGSFIKIDSLSYTRDYTLNRSECYRSLSPDNKITELQLLGYKEGDIRVSLELKKPSFDKVMAPLVAKGFNKPDPTSKPLGHHIIDIPNKEALNNFLAILNSVEPSISNIADKVKDSYAAVKCDDVYSWGNHFDLLDGLDCESDLEINSESDFESESESESESDSDFESDRELELSPMLLERLLFSVLLDALCGRDRPVIMREKEKPIIVSNQRTSLFGQSVKVKQPGMSSNEKSISDQEMAQSAFGQTSNTANTANTAKKLGR